MQSRRAFIGSAAAAAATAAAGVTFFSPADLVAQTGHAHDAAPLDPVSAEIHRQMAAAVQDIKAGKAEGARRMASLLRLTAAKTDDKAFDQTFRAGIRKMGGREAVLAAPLGADHLRRKAAEFGVTVQEADLQPGDYARRAQALDSLLSKGLSATHVRFADAFDRAAVEIERHGVLQPVARRQDSWCTTATIISNAAHDTMDAICAVAALFPLPLLDAACAEAISAWVASIGLMMIACIFGI